MRHGGHHVAQKSISTYCPRRLLSEIFSPVMASLPSKLGTSSPIDWANAAEAIATTTPTAMNPVRFIPRFLFVLSAKKWVSRRAACTVFDLDCTQDRAQRVNNSGVSAWED